MSWSGWHILASSVCLVVFFFLGSLLQQYLFHTVPAAVLGMLLLFLLLVMLGEVPLWLESGVQKLLRHFTLFLLPPTVGVVVLWPSIRLHAVAYGVALVVSVLVPLYVGGWLYQYLGRRG